MLKQITDFPGNNQLLYFTSPSFVGRVDTGI